MPVGRETPDITRIPEGVDVMMQKSYLREYAERHFPEVELIRLDRNETIVDDLYGESSSKRWQDPITIYSLATHEPPKKLLGKYGLEQSRDAMFAFTTMHLSELNILENRDDFLIGDLIAWGGDVYEIKDQSRDTESYWINTNIPLYIVCGADYYRQGE